MHWASQRLASCKEKILDCSIGCISATSERKMSCILIRLAWFFNSFFMCPQFSVSSDFCVHTLTFPMLLWAAQCMAIKAFPAIILLWTQRGFFTFSFLQLSPQIFIQQNGENGISVLLIRDRLRPNRAPGKVAGLVPPSLSLTSIKIAISTDKPPHLHCFVWTWPHQTSTVCKGIIACEVTDSCTALTDCPRSMKVVSGPPDHPPCPRLLGCPVYDWALPLRESHSDLYRFEVWKMWIQKYIWSCLL